MIEFPALTGAINPVAELIVATPTVPDVHAPASPFEVNVVAPLEQIAVVPANVPALGAVVTVTVAVPLLPLLSV